MPKYTAIAIIYNPNSTGSSEAMAKELKQSLEQKMSGAAIKLVATKHAGHAVELAKKIAKDSKRPLIISSSGDGGYHEVINGVMQAGNSQAICAVLPAGNANDHSRTMQDRPLAHSIIKGTVTKIDLIKVTIKAAGKQKVTYAHSYVGLGLTPIVATELNKTDLNALKEAWLAVKTFMKYRPFKIEHNGKVLQLDSLLFANINQMAKVLTLAKKNRPDDGKFEIIQFPARRKWQLIGRLAKAATTTLENPERSDSCDFITIKKMPMQLDGEVVKLQTGTKVLVESAHRVLKTIV